MLRSFMLLLLLICLMIVSCEKPPNFPETPEIAYKSINNSMVINSGLGGNKDSISVSITFKDGDGDLGLSQGDIGSSPYVGEFEKNYFVTTYRKVDGEFEKVEFDALELGGRFGPLTDESVTGPIEGTLNYAIEIPRYNTDDDSFALSRGDTLKFDVYIVDRDLNQSNTVETGEVIYFREE